MSLRCVFRFTGGGGIKEYVYFSIDRDLNFDFENYDIDYDLSMEEFGEPMSRVSSLRRLIKLTPSDYFFTTKEQIGLFQYNAIECVVMYDIIEELMSVLPVERWKDNPLAYTIDSVDFIRDLVAQLIKYWIDSARAGYCDIFKPPERIFHQNEEFAVIYSYLENSPLNTMETGYWLLCVGMIWHAALMMATEPGRICALAKQKTFSMHIPSQLDNITDFLYKRRAAKILTAIRMSDDVISKYDKKKTIRPFDFDDVIDMEIPWGDKTAYGSAIRKSERKEVAKMVIEAAGALQETGFIDNPIIMPVVVEFKEH